jgi:cytochrome c-type biogenesis protein CcmH
VRNFGAWISLLALLLAASPAGASERARKIEEMLVAPCCWSEAVAHHRSEVAAEIRAEIERMVAEGKSDREILDHFIARYGKRILIEPEGRTRAVATAMPYVFLALGSVVTVAVIRRMLRRPA